jgi:hypothetical protein
MNVNFFGVGFANPLGPPPAPAAAAQAQGAGADEPLRIGFHMGNWGGRLEDVVRDTLAMGGNAAQVFCTPPRRTRPAKDRYGKTSYFARLPDERSTKVPDDWIGLNRPTLRRI